MVRVIYVDPSSNSVEYLDVVPSREAWISLVGGYAARHWIVTQTLTAHEGYVNAEGLRRKKQLWFFRNVHIWGPMVIFGATIDGVEQPCTMSLEYVRGLCRFVPPKGGG